MPWIRIFAAVVLFVLAAVFLVIGLSDIVLAKPFSRGPVFVPFSVALILGGIYNIKK